MKHLTVTEAASSLGLAPATIRAQIANGAIRASKVGPLWVITEKEVERYRAVSRGKPGRVKYRVKPNPCPTPRAAIIAAVRRSKIGLPA